MRFWRPQVGLEFRSSQARFLGSRRWLFSYGGPLDVGVISTPESSKLKDIPLQKLYAHKVNNTSSLLKFNVDISVVDGKAMVAVPNEVFEGFSTIMEGLHHRKIPIRGTPCCKNSCHSE